MYIAEYSLSAVAHNGTSPYLYPQIDLLVFLGFVVLQQGCFSGNVPYW